MRKIPTLFKRNPDDMRHVLPEVTPGCEWVLDGHGVPTRKYDGTCVMFDGVSWWARREVKPGKSAPPLFVLAEHDVVTGKTVGWEPMAQSPWAKVHGQAVLAVEEDSPMPVHWTVDTYELVGPKINRNPERRLVHTLIRHADAEVLESPPAPLTYDIVADWMLQLQREHPGIEGVVWHARGDSGAMVKLKVKDIA